MREKFAVFVMVLLMVSMALFVFPPVEREAEGVTPRQSYDIQGSGGDFLGTDIVLADIDNDGNDEVIVSEYQYDGTFSNTGAIYIYELSNLLLAPKIISPDQQTNERFGISISVGDVNGDGYLDIAGGAYMYDTTTSTNAGRVYLYYYSAIGPSSTWMWSSTGDDVANAYFGQRVLIEDINMDGYDDVIVSAPRYNPGGSSYQGKLYIYYGSSSGPSTTPSWTYTPSVSNSYYGEGIAVGDYDGDSYPELAVTNSSYVDIFNCNSSGPESTPSWRLYTGSSRDIVMGDVNGDGKDDLLCGNNVHTSGGYTGRGRAVLYFGGKSEGSYTTPDWSVVGEAQTYANFGYTVGMGDFNGDGYDDAVISSIQYDATYVDQGKVYVYLSNGTNLQTTPEWTMLGTGSYTYLGWALLKNGRDVSGDGIDDVVITETGWNSNNGRVIFYYGTFVSTNISWKSTGPHQTGARFGYSLASGDFDGDGYKDLAIGAPYYDGANNDMGRVLVYNGSSGGLTSSPVWAQSPLNQLGAEFGYSLATGDFNGDGYDDLAVGAPYYDTSNTDAGRVLIYYGSSSGLATTVGASFSGPDQANANFGYTLSSGDYNGDGYDDLLVGAPWYDTISYTDAGAVYLYWGTPWGLASSYSHSYYGYQSSQSFGYSIATGDMYGDGIDDFAIGIPYEDYGGKTNCGGVRVYSGSTGGTPHQRYVFHGSYNNELFGNSITFGDFNGDGSDGLAVAAPLYSSGGTTYGRISVYRGTRYGLYYSFYILNRDSREYGVESISAGDIDGDGLEDLVVGSCLDDAPTYSRSAIYVHRGRSGSQPLLPDYSWRYRTATYNDLGYSTLSDDFNGDGLYEIVGGAPYDNLSMGIVYVWNG
ncbi:MAG: FG-GAP repeat protein [Thermoplasmata archaeon]|nr:FG-GAP repeat protein [Thermoplasmata archaeon]